MDTVDIMHLSTSSTMSFLSFLFILSTTLTGSNHANPFIKEIKVQTFNQIAEDIR
ncbi:MAG: hypothetical protein GY757_38105 [bacterium]|nr:hypothetical protein [bacterium]